MLQPWSIDQLEEGKKMVRQKKKEGRQHAGTLGLFIFLPVDLFALRFLSAVAPLIRYCESLGDFGYEARGVLSRKG